MGFDFKKAVNFAIDPTGMMLDKPDELKTFSTLAGGQQGVSSGLGAYLGGALQKMQRGYTGDYFAPPSPWTTQGIQALADYGGAQGQYLPMQQAAYSGFLAGRPSTQITPETTEQYYQDVIKGPALREWRDVVNPSIREAYGGPGTFWTSARAGAEAGGAERLGEGLRGARGELMYADEMARRQMAEAASQRQFAAMQMMSPEDQEAIRKSQALIQAGGMQQQIEQQRIDQEMMQWLGYHPSFAPILQAALGYLGIQMQGTYFEPQPGLLGQMANAAGQVGGIVTLGGALTDLLSASEGGGVSSGSAYQTGGTDPYQTPGLSGGGY